MKRKPTHPGICLKFDIIAPNYMTLPEASEWLNIDIKHLTNLTLARSEMTDDDCIKVAQKTGTTFESWKNMQLKFNEWRKDNENQISF